MEVIKLRNGSEEPRMLVAATMITLKSLMAENPLAFYELVQLCKNPSHKIFSKVQEAALIDTGLLSGDRVHGSIRNIVLSTTEGEGLEIRLKNPVMPSA